MIDPETRDLQFTRHVKAEAKVALESTRALVEEGLEYIRACEDSRLTIWAVFKELNESLDTLERRMDIVEHELDSWVRISAMLNQQRMAALNALAEVRRILTPAKARRRPPG